MGQISLGVDVDISMMGKSTLRKFLRGVKENIEKTVFTPEEQEKNKEKLASINAKLKAGKKLSAKEMAFLQRTDFDAYIHALRIQQTRKNLVSSLKHAKSKAQANLIIARAISSIDERDPDRGCLIAAINDIAESFKKSSAYQRLPETDRDARKKDRVNSFSDDAEDDEDSDNDDKSVEGDDTAADSVIAGEPTGSYQPTIGGGVEVGDLSRGTSSLDMAG